MVKLDLNITLLMPMIMGEGSKFSRDLEHYETIHHQNLSVTNQETVCKYFEGRCLCIVTIMMIFTALQNYFNLLAHGKPGCSQTELLLESV